jgi:hypothetical protein
MAAINAQERNREIGRYLFREENRARQLADRERQLRNRLQNLAQNPPPPPQNPPPTQQQQQNAPNQIVVRMGIDGQRLPNPNTPLSEEEVDTMMRQNEMHVAVGDEPFQCSICYDEPTNWIKSRNCVHGLCPLCFLNHTARSRFCPLCRIELFIPVAPHQNGPQQHQQQNNPIAAAPAVDVPNPHRPLTNEEASDMLMSQVRVGEGEAPFQCPVCLHQFVTYVRSRNCRHGMCPMCFLAHTNGARFCPQCHVDLYVPMARRN